MKRKLTVVPALLLALISVLGSFAGCANGGG